MGTEPQLTSASGGSYTLYLVQTERVYPIQVPVMIDEANVHMELDTGASLTIISEKTYHDTWPQSPPPLQPSGTKHHIYTGEELGVLGSFTATVKYKGQTETLDVLVLGGSGPSKARPVPFALKTKVEQELERLERKRIITPVQFSDWAAPIVPVVKSDGSIRICGDYRLTVNQASRLDAYPLPKVEELFASLAPGKSFTKLDLQHAYQQLTLEESSKPLTTINTHQGLFHCNRLAFGVSSAPGIFQRTMDNLLQGLSHVTVYLDDILIRGETEEQHLENLDTVLHKLERAGLRLKRSKCTFMAPEVEYLGHKISPQGLHPTPDKIRAIGEAPKPEAVSELKSFLGLLSYYSWFLPNASSTLTPLYSLLQSNNKWAWGSKEQAAFDTAKGMLQSTSLLVHYDPTKPLILACDASPYGVGAVLSHMMEDGSEKPVAFASRTLAPAEKNYLIPNWRKRVLP